MKLLTWADKLAGDGPESFSKQRATIRRVLEDPNNNMNKLIMNVLTEIDNDVLKTAFENFFLNAALLGWQTQVANREKYNCNIPWAILMDPTSACNLHCTGCWAAEYGNTLNLSFNELDDIITQGKELGIYMYIYTGGEPLTRKKDLIALCEKHNDCEFLSFTNGTLIDEDFANEMLRVKNFIPAISVEGFEEATDARRGKGTYANVVKAMTLLKEKHLPFGISCCYTSQNMDSISSAAFIDQMIDYGARFAWYFHYMPVGNDAAPELLPTSEQREAIYHRLRAFRATKPIFIMDFQNDGEYVGGCIAGGRRYLHINANGDCDPCVFVHYSNANIRDTKLLDVFRSRFLWPTTTVNHLTTTTFVLVLCSKIRKSCVKWFVKPVHIPPICNRRNRWTISAKNATVMLPNGRRWLTNSGTHVANKKNKANLFVESVPPQKSQVHHGAAICA